MSDFNLVKWRQDLKAKSGIDITQELAGFMLGELSISAISKIENGKIPLQKHTKDLAEIILSFSKTKLRRFIKEKIKIRDNRKSPIAC